MKFEDELGGDRVDCGVGRHEGESAEMDEALKDFRLSIQAWSEAAYSRSRTVTSAVERKQLRRWMVGWSLGCFLLVGCIAGGVWEHLHQAQLATTPVARVIEYQKPTAPQQAPQLREKEDDLLAKVDNDVSREIPSAMEPLAQLMAEDKTQ